MVTTDVAMRRSLREEQRTRPVAAELTVEDGAAVLRLLDRNNRVSADRYQVTLPGACDYISGPVLTRAGEFIAAAGFRLDGGWDEEHWQEGLTRTVLDVTPDYLAYIERKFGKPSLGGLPAGIIAHRTGRASWQLHCGGHRFDLCFTAKLSGPEWTLSCGGRAATEHDGPQEAVTAAVGRIRLSDGQGASGPRP